MVRFRHLVPLLASRGFPLGEKGRLFSLRVHSIMLYESDTSLVTEKDMIRLARNDASMVR